MGRVRSYTPRRGPLRGRQHLLVAQARLHLLRQSVSGPAADLSRSNGHRHPQVLFGLLARVLRVRVRSQPAVVVLRRHGTPCLLARQPRWLPRPVREPDQLHQRADHLERSEPDVRGQVRERSVPHLPQVLQVSSANVLLLARLRRVSHFPFSEFFVRFYLFFIFSHLRHSRATQLARQRSIYAPVRSLFESLQTLFWASFGLIDLENFELTGESFVRSLRISTPLSA